MARRNVIFSALCLVMAIAGIAWFSGPDVSGSIRQLVHEGKSEEIRLADAARFEWDEAYVFGPYTGRSQVCDTLRIQARYCERQIGFESKDDGEMSIAFLAGGRLVHYARHSRANGDFASATFGLRLTPQTAVFRVQRGVTANQRVRVELVLM